MLLLPSYLQIKAKNYDKVEKVSILHTLEANSCVFNACKSAVRQFAMHLGYKRRGHFSHNAQFSVFEAPVLIALFHINGYRLMCFFFLVIFIWLCETMHMLGRYLKNTVTFILHGKSQLENKFLTWLRILQ